MANTYTQIHLQLVFAVKYRQAIIQSAWEEELYRYIAGIVDKQAHKLLWINGTQDHLHMLIGLRPAQSISDLLQDIKGGSSLWINEHELCPHRFEWQKGYGAFSYARKEVPDVIEYIRNQKEHHKQESFLDEYRRLLKGFGVDYDERYIFTEPE